MIAPHHLFFVEDQQVLGKSTVTILGSVLAISIDIIPNIDLVISIRKCEAYVISREKRIQFFLSFITHKSFLPFTFGLGTYIFDHAESSLDFLGVTGIVPSSNALTKARFWALSLGKLLLARFRLLESAGNFILTTNGSSSMLLFAVFFVSFLFFFLTFVSPFPCVTVGSPS